MNNCFCLGAIYYATILLMGLAASLLIGTSAYIWCRFPLYGAETDLSSFATVGLSVGIIALVLAVILLIVMCCKHRALLYIMALLSAVIVCFQLGATLWLLTQESGGRIDVMNLDTYPDTPEYIDNVQTEFNCCGITAPTDWVATEWGQAAANANKLPASCCDVTADSCQSDRAYTVGCGALVDRYMDICYNIILITAIVILVIQLAVIVLSCCVARALKERAYEELSE